VARYDNLNFSGVNVAIGDLDGDGNNEDRHRSEQRAWR
jgi:hypothetical protein